MSNNETFYTKKKVSVFFMNPFFNFKIYDVIIDIIRKCFCLWYNLGTTFCKIFLVQFQVTSSRSFYDFQKMLAS